MTKIYIEIITNQLLKRLTKWIYFLKTCLIIVWNKASEFVSTFINNQSGKSYPINKKEKQGARKTGIISICMCKLNILLKTSIRITL